MTVFDYIKSAKYQNYKRNEAIFHEKSAGIFNSEVQSRIKLELMGAGAITKGNSVLTGYNGDKESYSPISCLIVPSTLLSSTTSAYISYATNGEVLIDGDKNPYFIKKIKEIIKIQSIGGSCLIKKIEEEGDYFINIYTPLTYFAEYDEFIQDRLNRYTIFNKYEESEHYVSYMLEIHEVKNNMIIYRIIEKDKESGNIRYIDTQLEGYRLGEDEDGIFSYEEMTEVIVSEVNNTVFGGESDYTDDNVALLRELIVTNTINSQTFDKISNPLLALPEEALEYDQNGNAKVNLQDRVVIIRDGGNKPEQISLQSVIDQSQLHKENIEQNIFSSLAINKTALGLTDVSQLSGEALRRMMSPTIARVTEKRDEVKEALERLFDIEITFPEVVAPSFIELVSSVGDAVANGVMSQEKGVKMVSGEDDVLLVKAEKLEGDYLGFEGE